MFLQGGVGSLSYYISDFIRDVFGGSKRFTPLIFFIVSVILLICVSLTTIAPQVKSQDHRRWSALESNRNWILLNSPTAFSEISLRELGQRSVDYIFSIGEEKITDAGTELFGSAFRLKSGIRWNIDHGLEGDGDIVIPLYEGDEQALFLQPGFSFWRSDSGHDRIDLNIGLGWRSLIGSKRDAAIGLALFYDHNLNHDLSRIGVSKDIQSGRLSISASGYFPLQKWRQGQNGYEERALLGGDINFDYAITDKINIRATGSIWQKKGKAQYGAKIAGIFKLDRGFSLVSEYEYFDSGLLDDRFYLGLEFEWPYAWNTYLEPQYTPDLFKIIKREKRILYEERKREEKKYTVPLSISISPNIVREDREEAFTITVQTKNGIIARDNIEIPISYSGTATRNIDYIGGGSNTLIPESVTIIKGQSFATIGIVTVNDDIKEMDETIIVSIVDSNLPKGVSLEAGKISAEVTIMDNEEDPSSNLSIDRLSITDNADAPSIDLSAAPTSISESAGGTSITITATASGTSRSDTITPTASGTSSSDITVPVEIDLGGYAKATDISDITISAGERTGTMTFTLTPNNDSVDNIDRRIISLSVGGGIANGVGGDGAEIAIIDDEGAPSVDLTVAPTSVLESATGTSVTITATASGASSSDITVPVEIDLGGYATATNISDITISAGERTGTTTFTLTPKDNDIDDVATRTISLSVGGGIANGVGGDDAEIAITDDEGAPSVDLTVAPTSVLESATGRSVTITATASGTSSSDITVPVEIDLGGYATATNISDITISAGGRTGITTFTLTPNNDSVDNIDRRIISLSVGGGIVNGVGGDDAEITIIDDEGAPSVDLTVAPTSISESATGTSVTITATASGTSSSDITVPVEIDLGGYATATNISDITISAGERTGTMTFTLTPNNDSVDNIEKRIISLSVGGGIVNGVGGDDAEITIIDDEGAPSVDLTVAPTSISESATGTSVTITATASGTSSSDIMVPVEIDLGGYATATNISDITISAGERTGTMTFTLTPNNDSVDNIDRRIISLSVGGGIVNGVGGDGAEIAITDDEGAPSVDLTVAPTSVSESAGGTSITITATASGTSSSDITVPVEIDLGGYATATNISDITISAGDRTGTTTFTLTPNNDSVHNIDKRFISLSVGGGIVNGVGGDGAEIAIIDDEGAPSVDLTVAPTSVLESASGRSVTITATASGTSSSDITVPVEIDLGGYATATDISDITISAGERTGTTTFTLTPKDNDIDDIATRTISLSVGDDIANGVGGDDAEIEIIDDESAPSVDLTVAPRSVSESAGGTLITITATASGTSSSDITVPVEIDLGGYATVTDISDITISAGGRAGTTTFTLTPNNDSVDNIDKRIISLSVGDDIANGVGGDDAEIAIIDDEGAPSVDLTVAPTSVLESATGTSVTITATASGTSSSDITVPVEIDLGGYATATNISDITISAGDRTGTTTFTLTPNNDLVDNIDRRIISLSVGGGIANGVGGDGAEIAIIDDEGAPSVDLTVAPTSISESATGTSVTITATASGTSSSDITVPVSIDLGGYARATDISNITISAGERTGTTTFTLTPNNDSVDNIDKRIISLSVGGGIVNGVGGDGAEIAIIDDEGAPSVDLTVAPTSISESASGRSVTITATASGTSSSDITVPVSIDLGGYATATDISDITISAGGRTGTTTFTLTPNNDSVDNIDRRIISLSVGGGIVHGVGGDDAEITIIDDEGAPSVDLTVAPTSISESATGTSVTITATASGTSSSDITVPVEIDLGGYATATDISDITISAGGRSGTTTFTLTPKDNDIDDVATRTISLSVGGGIVNGVGGDGAEIAIIDDEGAPSVDLTVAPTSISESASGRSVTITATASGTSSSDITVPVEIDLGGYATATDISDITISAGGRTGTTTFTLTPKDNDIDDVATRTISLSVGGGIVNGVVGDGAEIAIIDDEGAPSVDLTVAPTSVLESASGTSVTITATASGTSSSDITVPVAIDLGGYATATNISDITISAGERTGTTTFTLTPNNDSVDNIDRRIISLSVGGGIANGVGGDGAEIAIIDDEGAPSVDLTVAPTSISESATGTSVTITATASGTSSSDITVPVSIDLGGYARATDISNITISAGERTGTTTFTLTPNNDSVDNIDKRIISLSVGGGIVNGVGGDGAEITIIDDEGAPSVDLTVAPTSISESASGRSVTITATASGTSSSDITVPVEIDLGGYATATDISDITISAGGRTGTTTFTLTPKDNDIDDVATRTISLSVGGGIVNGVVGDGAEIAIIDDEGAPSVDLTVAPTSVLESASGTSVTITATASGTSSSDITVPVAIDLGGYATATDISDITISAGERTGTTTFTLTPKDNDIDDVATRTISLSVGGGIANGVGGDGAEIAIIDDEGAPSVDLTVAPTSILESATGTSITITATASGTSSSDITVPVEIDLGGYATATNISDITISAGERTGTTTFTLTPNNDSVDNIDRRIISLLVGDDIANGVGGDGAEIEIIDDESAPSVDLTVAPTSISESASGTSITIMATASGTSSSDITVPVEIDLGGYARATNISDITISAGDRTGTTTFTLTPKDNDIDDIATRTISLSVGGGIVNGVGGDDAEIAITDDDGAPSVDLTVAPTSVLESASGTSVTITATASGTSSSDITVPVEIDLGGYARATNISDITISAGDRTGTTTFTLTPKDNDIDDIATRTISLSVGGGIVNGVGGDDAEIAITDDDGAPSVDLTVAPTSVLESASGTSITIMATASGTSSSDITVPVEIDLGGYATATDISDITISAGGRTGTTTFTLTPNNDSVDNIDRRIISLSVGGGIVNGVGGDGAEIAIIDDEGAPSVDLTVAPTSVSESATGTLITIMATASGTSSSDITVPVEIDLGGYATATDISDITISAGERTGTTTFTLTPNNDSVDNIDRRIISLSVGGGIVNGVGGDGAEIAITDDEGAPSVDLTVAPTSVSESASGRSVTITATASGTSSSDITVPVSIDLGGYATATDISDITISAGGRTGTTTFTLTPNNDSVDNIDRRIISLSVGGGIVNGVGGDGAEIAIIDDEGAPSVDLTVAPTSVSESATGTLITIMATASGTSSSDITVPVSIDLGGYATATNISDITISAGERSGTTTFTLTPKDNDIDDVATRTISLSVGGGIVNGVGGDGAEIVITDDEEKPVINFSVNPSVISENAGPTVVTVTATASHASEQIIPIPMSVLALPQYGFATDPEPITIAAGEIESTTSFIFTPNDNNIDETGPKGILILPKNLVESATLDGGAEVSISDDDSSPVLSVQTDTLSLDDRDSSAIVTITFILTHPSDQDVRADVRYSGTALKGSDYKNSQAGESLPDHIIIPAGELFSTIRISPIPDGNGESDEKITVGIGSSVMNAIKGSPTSVDIVVPANDFLTFVNLSVSSTSLSENAGTTAVTVTATTLATSNDDITVTIGLNLNIYATATALSDITIPAGELTGEATFMLTPKNDSFYNTKARIISFSIRSIKNGIASGGASIEITDDEGPPTINLSVNPESIAENIGPTRILVTATADHESDADITVPIAVDLGGYVRDSMIRDITIPVGSMRVTRAFNLTPINNAVNDVGTRRISLSIGNVVNGVAGNGAVIEITDDEATPSVHLSVDTQSILEDAGATQIRVTATSSGISSADITVPVEINLGGYARATDISDITISAGERTGTTTFTLTPNDNSVDNIGKRIISLSVGGDIANGVVGDDAEIEIIDDESTPNISLRVDPNNISEDAGATVVTVTATASHMSSANIRIVFHVRGQSHAKLSAFPLIIIPAGERVGASTFTLTPNNDSIDNTEIRALQIVVIREDNAIVNVGDKTKDVRIIDDEDTPSVDLSVAPTSISESATGTLITITATASGTSSSDITVPVEIDLGGYATATDISDITISAGGRTGTTTFTLTPKDNDIDDIATRTISLSVGGGIVNGVGGDDAEIEIIDDESAPSVDLTVAPTSVLESASGTLITITATASGTSSSDITVPVEINLGGYATATDISNITISAGGRTGTTTFTLTPKDNDIDDVATRTISLSVGGGIVNGVGGDDAEIAITDDEDAQDVPIVNLNFGETGVQENNVEQLHSLFGLNAQISKPIDKDIIVPIETSFSSSVRPFARFNTAPASELTIRAGQTRSEPTSFVLIVIGDDIYNAMERYLTISIGDEIKNARKGSSVRLNIIDDESKPAVNLSVVPTSISENVSQSEIMVTARASHRSDSTITVPVVAVIDSASPVRLLLGNIEIAAGERTKTVPFTLPSVNDDIVNVVPRYVTFSVGDIKNGVAGDSARVEIKDNERAQVSLSVDSSFLGEGAGRTQVTVTASASRVTDREITVPIVIDTGSFGTVTSSPQPITIPIGQRVGVTTFIFTPTDNQIIDRDERKITLSIGAIENGVKGDGTTISIIDDDQNPPRVNLRVSPTNVAEDGGATQITVTARAERAIGKVITAPISINTGSFGTVTASPSPIIIPVGMTEGKTVFTFRPANNDDFNGNVRQITVSPGSVQNGVAGSSVAINIRDDETPTVDLRPTIEVVETGDSQLFSLSMSASASKSIDVDITVPINIDLGPADRPFARLIIPITTPMIIPANKTVATQTISLTILDNNFYNMDRDIILSIGDGIRNAYKGSGTRIRIKDSSGN